MTGQTSTDFSSSSPSQMDYEGSTTPNDMKSKVRVNALYNTPRARRFTERVAEAVEVSTLNRTLDDAMVLDLPSPIRNEDVDMMDPSSSPLQLRNNKTIRKRRSLAKFNETQQRQRRKLRHAQQHYKSGSSSSAVQASRGSDDDYEDDQEDEESDDEFLYSNGGSGGSRNSRRLASRQSSVGSEEGGNLSSTQATSTRSATTNGRTRRRLRLQNSSNIPMDRHEIDEDASPTFFPAKSTRLINPVVVLGTTHGVTKENRRRRPDPIAEKLDRLRHAPDINMLDLSKHLIIPDNTNHNNAASPSSSTSTAASATRHQEQSQQESDDREDRTSGNSGSSSSSNTDEEEEKEDREESPISIPDNDDNIYDNGDDDDDDMDLEQASQVIIENLEQQQQQSENVTHNTTTTTIKQEQIQEQTQEQQGKQEQKYNDTMQNDPLDLSPVDMEDQFMSPMVHDTTIESPSSPITPQPLTMTLDNSTSATHTIGREIASTHTNMITQSTTIQHEPIAETSQTEMESITAVTAAQEEEQTILVHKIKQEVMLGEEQGEEGKAHSGENSYIGRVVGSVSRFFWGS